MRTIALLIAAATLQAATYYVSSAGNDSNAGSSGAPWLTLNHAVNSVACGDTIIVVANGAYVAGDANLPYFPGCGATTTVQSSGLGTLWPIGWRTNPGNDSSAYGRLQFTNQGIVAQPEPHGSWTNGGNYANCNISALASDVFTLGYCGSGLANLGNSSQVEMEINSEGSLTASALPAGLVLGQKYYVVNCTGTCGTSGSTLQLSATSGGPAITGLSCSGTCVLGALQLSEPLQVTAGSATITSPDAFVTWANGTPIAFSAAGFQSFGTLPPPLELNAIYYLVNVSSNTFQVASTPGGSPITLTDVGSGPLQASNTNLPHDWAFRGLELTEVTGHIIYGFFVFGSGWEASAAPGLMVSNMEVDRSWIHDQPGDTAPPRRGIADNGQNLFVHDSYLAGFSNSEAQAIAGWGSPGPTLIQNNFLEASGENTLYGGQWNSSGTPNAYKTFSGNYIYKPPVWKVTTNTGAASGACWWDNTDPNHSGGEWYYDMAGAQWYQCNSSGSWAATGSTPNTNGNPLVKDGTEHKNGQYFTYSGNLYRYIWAQAQSGEAFNNSAEAGSGPGMADDHIVISNNAIYNVFQLGTRTSQCFLTSVLPCLFTVGQHALTNNLVVIDANACGVLFSTGTPTCGYHAFDYGWFSSPGYPLQTDVYSHNTIWTQDGFPLLGLTPNYGTSPNGTCTFPAAINLAMWTNSIVPGDYTGDCFSGGAEIAAYFSNSTFTNLALKGGTSGAYSSVGSSNTFNNVSFPSSNSNISYVNGTGAFSGGDYHLAPTSLFSAMNPSPTLLSSDGMDLGADVDSVNMATSGASVGTPPIDHSLEIRPGSTGAIFRYLAPSASSGACTATLYNAPARIPANQVASIADSSSSSVSDVQSRQLVIPTGTLAASTHYWYSIKCGGSFILVGDFTTLKAGAANSTITINLATSQQIKACNDAALTSGCTTYPASTSVGVSIAANSIIYHSPVVTGGGTLPPTAEIAP